MICIIRKKQHKKASPREGPCLYFGVNRDVNKMNPITLFHVPYYYDFYIHLMLLDV